MPEKSCWHLGSTLTICANGYVCISKNIESTFPLWKGGFSFINLSFVDGSVDNRIKRGCLLMGIGNALNLKLQATKYFTTYII